MADRYHDRNLPLDGGSTDRKTKSTPGTVNSSAPGGPQRTPSTARPAPATSALPQYNRDVANRMGDEAAARARVGRQMTYGADRVPGDSGSPKGPGDPRIQARKARGK